MFRFTLTLAVALALSFAGCGTSENQDDAKKHEDGHHHHDPAHGGFLVELAGGQLHIELKHEGKEGKLTAYVTGADGKTAEAIESAPVLKLLAKEGSKELTMQAQNPKDGKSTVFQVVDAELKDGPEGMPNLLEPLQGRLTLTYKGKVYNSDFKEEAHEH